MKQKPTDYRNRIKALEYVDAADLTAHPGNWREHPQAQAEAMRGVLAEVGIAGALLAYRSERQGGALVVIDGHLRKDAAPQAWPVLILDVDDAEADYILATHDPLAAMATADAGALDALLSSVQSGEAAVTAMLAELAEGAGLYAPKDESDAEPQIDRAEELRQEWGVEPGQLWRLPSRTPGQEHRLICGDCTDAAVVERVMGDQLAQMIFTDPPYGVDVAGGSHDPRDTQNYRSGNTIEGDTLDDDALSKLWGDAFREAQRVCVPGAVVYACFSDLRAYPSLRGLVAAGIYQSQFVIWAKQQMVFSRKDYHPQHEPIIYGWMPGAAHNAVRSRDKTTLWQIDRPMRSDKEHPTQKPVDLPRRAIENHDAPILYDPFLGSGTTIIAAENLSRQCRAVEISPAYCAVALQRYCDAFGITPELIA